MVDRFFLSDPAASHRWQQQFWAAVESEPKSMITPDQAVTYLGQAPASDPLALRLLHFLESGHSRTTFDWQVERAFPIREKPVVTIGRALTDFFTVNPVVRVRDLYDHQVSVQPRNSTETISLRLVKALNIYWRVLRQEMIDEGLIGNHIGPDPRNETVLDLVYFKIMGEPRWNSSWGARKKGDQVIPLPWKKQDIWPTVQVSEAASAADIRTNLTNAFVLLNAMRSRPVLRERGAFSEDTKHRLIFYNRLTGQVVPYLALLCQVNQLLHLARQKDIFTVPDFAVDFLGDQLTPNYNNGSARAFPSRTTRENLWRVLERQSPVLPAEAPAQTAPAPAPARIIRRRAGAETELVERPPVAKAPVRELVLKRQSPDLTSLQDLNEVLAQLSCMWPRLSDGQLDLSLVKRPVNLSLGLKFVDGKISLERLLRHHHAVFSRPECAAARAALEYLPDNPGNHFYFLWALRIVSGLDLTAPQIFLPDRIIELPLRDFANVKKILKFVLSQFAESGEKFDAPTVRRYLALLPNRRGTPLQDLVVGHWTTTRMALMKARELPSDFPRKVQNARVMPVLQRHLEIPAGRPGNNLAHHRSLFLQQLTVRQGQLGLSPGLTKPHFLHN